MARYPGNKRKEQQNKRENTNKATITDKNPSTAQDNRIGGEETTTLKDVAEDGDDDDDSDDTYELEEEEEEGEESESDEDLEIDYDGDEDYREDDIPNIGTVSIHKAQRTPQMAEWQLENDDLIRRYFSEKVAGLIETTNFCIDAGCFDDKCDTSLDDWENMIYHDLMKPHWTDEGILKWEVSHQMFKDDKYDDLNDMMERLRSDRNPDQHRINTYFPPRTFKPPPTRHPYDLVEGIYAMHILRMKRLLDRASFRIEDWVTTALAMEWARQTLLRSGRYMTQLRRKYPPGMMNNASNSLLALIVVRELRDKPCETRVERVRRGREGYVETCLEQGISSWDGGLAEGDNMRVRWHCTPYEW
ncbi:hypothetical protein RRF57_009431 [Xylaria bambusicola]|uniref:Uncharacterized protein n=1 Tax=Xylaria bambusicola TaxID=326684 RepID=A0AAN7UQW7_9PEZI